VGQFKLEFGSDSPAWRFYEALRAEGRSDPEIDHGYHRLDYRKPGPDGVLVNQRESHEEREVLEHVTDRYERYRRLIESYTGYPLSWVIDDPAIKARVAEAIGRIEAILRSQGLRPKTATYEEKLAVALFYFADFPEAPKDRSFSTPIALERTSELPKIGLQDFQKFLFEKGGLGLASHPEAEKLEELSADEAIRKKRSKCTDKSKVLFAVLREAGLRPRYVKVLNRELLRIARTVGIVVSPDSRDIDHVALHMTFGGRTRILDLQIFNSDAVFKDYYLLTPLQFLSSERTNRGFGLLHVGKLDKATLEFREAVRLEPESALAHLGLCQALANQKRFPDAEQECQEAIRNQPDTASPYIGLGLVLMQAQNFEKAGEHFAKAVAIDPLNLPARIFLADSLFAGNKFAEAAGEYRHAIPLTPHPGPLQFKLGLSRLEQRRYREAVRDFQLSIRSGSSPTPLPFGVCTGVVWK